MPSRHLTKEQLSEFQRLRSDIEDTLAELSDRVSAFQTFQDETATALQERFDARSEKWQDSDAGQALATTIDLWSDTIDFGTDDMVFDFDALLESE